MEFPRWVNIARVSAGESLDHWNKETLALCQILHRLKQLREAKKQQQPRRTYRGFFYADRKQ